MNLNWIGLTAALATFFSIWFGHVAVRKIEATTINLWISSGIAWGLGLVVEIGAVSSPNKHMATALGIIGVTLLWDGLEFWRQQNRVKKGHAPANPNNPRHKKILAEFPLATTFDWLKRDPTGFTLTQTDLIKIKEGTL